MMLPKDIDIIRFIEKFFIKSAAPDEIVTNELVRIAYYDGEGSSTNNPNVKLKFKQFDIYVKDDVLHNASRDRLKDRGVLIAERLKYLLLRQDTVCGLRVQYEDEHDMWTKVAGYKRYHVTFNYKTTV